MEDQQIDCPKNAFSIDFQGKWTIFNIKKEIECLSEVCLINPLDQSTLISALEGA
jgi:hypothetical protein